MVDAADRLRAQILRDLRALLAQDEKQPDATIRLGAEVRLALETAIAQIEADRWQAAHDSIRAVFEGPIHPPYRKRLERDLVDLTEGARLRGVDILV